MPYSIKVNRKGKRPFKIVNTSTGKVVGSSVKLSDAQGSIGHRVDAERAKRRLE